MIFDILIYGFMGALLTIAGLLGLACIVLPFAMLWDGFRKKLL